MVISMVGDQMILYIAWISTVNKYWTQYSVILDMRNLVWNTKIGKRFPDYCTRWLVIIFH